MAPFLHHGTNSSSCLPIRDWAAAVSLTRSSSSYALGLDEQASVAQLPQPQSGPLASTTTAMPPPNAVPDSALEVQAAQIGALLQSLASVLASRAIDRLEVVLGEGLQRTEQGRALGSAGCRALEAATLLSLSDQARARAVAMALAPVETGGEQLLQQAQRPAVMRAAGAKRPPMTATLETAPSAEAQPCCVAALLALASAPAPCAKRQRRSPP